MDASEQQLVIDATKKATQEVAARNRRRLRVESLLIGIIVASSIAIPTTLFLSKQSARTNCALVTELATLGTESLSAEKAELHEFERTSHDRFGLTQAEFEKLVVKKRRHDEHRQDVLERIAHHSC